MWIGFHGELYDISPETISITPPKFKGETKNFKTTESAYHALKFWSRADEFEPLLGEEAFQLKKRYGGQEDFSFAGFGSNWKAMRQILRAKFVKGSRLAESLSATGDNFLIDHNRIVGKDTDWSNGGDGNGKNWLGMQLMYIRDELSGTVGQTTQWSSYIAKVYDFDEGKAHSAESDADWQSVVKSATEVVQAKFEAP